MFLQIIIDKKGLECSICNLVASMFVAIISNVGTQKAEAIGLKVFRRKKTTTSQLKSL